MKNITIYGLGALFVSIINLYSQSGAPIRPLAQDCIVLERTANVNNPLYTPSICVGDGGRLIAAYEYGHFEVKGAGASDENARISTSDDGGKTWTLRAREFMTHGRIFKSGSSYYYLGHRGHLRICRSDDNGATWTRAVKLIPSFAGGDNHWHQSACNVLHSGGYVYLVMEHNMYRKFKGWGVSELAPVVMRAKEDSDLTKIESWTFSNRICMADIFKNFAKNELPELDYFGVPFYKQSYPDGHYRINTKSPYRGYAALGMLETNIVKIEDPSHIWCDPQGKTFHLFMRANTGGTGYCALLKAVEKPDGSIEVGLEKVPSGKNILFMPFPVGQMRFHICYDDKTKLYWLLGTQATDSMIKPDAMADNRFDLPNNERQRMVLYFSKNLVDWCFAGLVAKVDGNNQSRHYASMDIDGDDLVILSRSGDKDARSAHNGNIITFHRVKNFRELVY